MRVFCIGRNYAAHAEELGNEKPSSPVVFMKPHTAVVNTPAQFHYPTFSNDIHFECEVVLRIGTGGKHIQQSEALQHISDYTLGIDFTARDIQSNCKEKRISWELAKAFDESAPVGKWKSAEGVDFTQLQFSFEQNSEIKQTGDTSLVLFPFDYLISYLSEFFELQEGDLIFTGTPKGVGPIAKADHLVGKLGEETVLEVQVK